MVQLFEKLTLKVDFKENKSEVFKKQKNKKSSLEGVSNPRYYENALTPRKARIIRDRNMMDIFKTPI